MLGRPFTGAGVARLALIACQLSLCLAGCGCSASCSVGTGGSGASSQAFLTQQVPSQLAAVLPTALEVASLPGAPASGFVRVPLDQANLMADAKAHGPCGGSIAQPSLRRGAIAAYSSPAHEEITWWADRLADGVAHQFIAAVAADAIRGCPDYHSPTTSGSSQTNHFIGTIPTPGIGDGALGAMLRLQSGGHSIYGAELSIRRGNYLLIAVTYSAQPIAAAFAQAVAKLADTHLSAVAGG